MLKYNTVRIEGFGYALPEEPVTSEELERRLAPVYERFGLHAGRLELMSGIKERRFWKRSTLPSDASTQAGRHAMERSGTSAKDIECLLHTSVSRDFLEPATASVVHDNLSIPGESIMYDISNACLGFLNGMVSLANMIELGQVRRGLIVAGESSRQLVESTIDSLLKAKDLSRAELKQAIASLTIGSGAAAVVLAHESVAKTTHKLIGGVIHSATEHNKLCRGSADTGFGESAHMTMQTDAERLLETGCALASKTWGLFKSALGWTVGEVDRVFTHQVGQTHRDRFLEAIGIDPNIDFSTFPFLGNTGSAALPMTMAMGIEQNPPKEGEHLGLLGIGSGLSCVMLGVKW